MLMIIVKTENYNHISQEFYNNTTNSLALNLIPCTCGRSGCLTRYGSYIRSIQLTDGILSLTVARVCCKVYGHTRALLLSSMVPYSQLSLSFHVRLISSFEHRQGLQSVLNGQYCVDENNLKSLLRKYSLYWKERILSAILLFSDIRKYRL